MKSASLVIRLQHLIVFLDDVCRQEDQSNLFANVFLHVGRLKPRGFEGLKVNRGLFGRHLALQRVTGERILGRLDQTAWTSLAGAHSKLMLFIRVVKNRVGVCLLSLRAYPSYTAACGRSRPRYPPAPSDLWRRVRWLPK